MRSESPTGMRAARDEALLYVEYRGSKLAVARIRREVIPFNFDELVKIRSTITRVSKRGGLLLFQVPASLRHEHSLYRSFQPGDVLVAYQLGCLAILTEPLVPEGIELFKAGEVVEGFENLSRLQPGDTVKLRVATGEAVE
ncbi:MAG: hypothetical protein QW650_01480 [Thermofilum sp.]